MEAIGNWRRECCQELRPVAGNCRFFHCDGTRHGTRRGGLIELHVRVARRFTPGMTFENVNGVPRPRIIDTKSLIQASP